MGERGDGPVAVAAFITPQGAERIPHAVTCRALGVSQSWYYKWRCGDASPRHARRAQLTIAARRVFAVHKGRYGSPRLVEDLREEGWTVSVNTVAALMAEQHLVARRKRRRKHTTRQGRGRWRAPDLICRDFAADGVNQKWYGDGTVLKTGEGKLYLDSVLDAGSRRIIGHAIGQHHDAPLAEAALQTAIAVRGGRDKIAGVITHTDQGSEFTAGLFRKACTRCRIRQSMGRVGSALDNSVIESWHSTLEFELRSLEKFPTRQAARTAVTAWIGDYNQNRRHSSIGMRSPIQYEAEAAAAEQQEGRAGSGRPLPSPAIIASFSAVHPSNDREGSDKTRSPQKQGIDKWGTRSPCPSPRRTRRHRTQQQYPGSSADPGLGVTSDDLDRGREKFPQNNRGFGQARGVYDGGTSCTRDGATELLLYHADEDDTGPHVRVRVGWQHLAFEIASHAEVDRPHKIETNACWTIVRQPKEHPRFMERYYASFVEDNNGIRLEFMFNPLRASDAG